MPQAFMTSEAAFHTLLILMVGHGGSSAGSYLADPTSPIPSHCASIVATSTVRVKHHCVQNLKYIHSNEIGHHLQAPFFISCKACCDKQWHSAPEHVQGMRQHSLHQCYCAGKVKQIKARNPCILVRQLQWQQSQMYIIWDKSLHGPTRNCYMRHHHTIIRAAFVRLFVPLLLRGPLTDLRQTWWVYVSGPRNCPWGVLFWKAQRVNGSTGQTSLFRSRRHQAETTPLQKACPAKGTRRLRV